MPKKSTDEEKLNRYNEMIQKQIVRNVKWVDANPEKYKELMCTYSKNYYEKKQGRIEYETYSTPQTKKIRIGYPNSFGGRHSALYPLYPLYPLQNHIPART